ncbi:IclR family transcriptional regulator [Haloarcula sp. JP-L23]|uniref:IclR family transcriptional regulator n=1 Tax=Haloarcula sp. JP-L23 TaxID=2716717 RepID=UPI001D04327F
MSRPTISDPAEMDGRVARTTVTSFRIVDALRDRDAVGVTELADELSLGKGTVHKHLNTLHEMEYVVKEKGKYRLSLGFLGLGASVRTRMPIYRVIQQPLENLAESTGEAASVLIPEHTSGIYLARVTTGNEPPAELYEGKRVPLTATAAGKAILAYLPADERDRILDESGLPKLTDNTITDRETMLEELQTIHDDRTAHDRGELEADRHCVASPITDADNTAIAAVSVSGPAERMREKSIRQDFPSILGSTATSIKNRVANEQSKRQASADPNR